MARSARTIESISLLVFIIALISPISGNMMGQGSMMGQGDMMGQSGMMGRMMGQCMSEECETMMDVPE